MATIMVIDDEPSIRGLLREVLERSGHKVVEAKDGREALDLYQKHKADLLIMDLLMPEVDGLEATLQLTREYMDTKIIAMTGAQGIGISSISHGSLAPTGLSKNPSI
ncbi:MAG: response regulator [Nitrospira sp.]|nr:response regulator [Nitrospira sp.]